MICCNPDCNHQQMTLIEPLSTWTTNVWWCSSCGRTLACKTGVGKLCEAAPVVIAGAAIAALLGIDIGDHHMFDDPGG